MSNSKSTLPRIEFKSDALSTSAWTEAYYTSEAFERGRKRITDTKPHKPVKLSYSGRAAEEVLGDVRDKIAHIREGLLGPEERRGDNEQWIMDLAEVEAVFDEAIRRLAVEPVRTVTVELTNAELDSIGLALRLAYDDQASYVQKTARNAILRPRGLSLGNFARSLGRQAVLDCTVRRSFGNRSLATGARSPST